MDNVIKKYRQVLNGEFNIYGLEFLTQQRMREFEKRGEKEYCDYCFQKKNKNCFECSFFIGVLNEIEIDL